MLRRAALQLIGSLAAGTTVLAAPPPANQVRVPLYIRLREANLRFGLRLFEEQLRQSPNRNILVAPLSLQFSLALLLQRASEPVQRSLTTVLDWRDIEATQAAEAAQMLRSQLGVIDERVQLQTAHAFWASSGERFVAEAAVLAQPANHLLLVAGTDEASARARLGDWWRNYTDTLQPPILPPPAQGLVVLDSTSFAGPFTQGFPPEATSDGTFLLPDGTRRSVPFMRRTSLYRYYETPRFQAVSLPFGANSEWNLVVFLPFGSETLASFVRQLNETNWRLWRRQFALRDGLVVLPRFQLQDASRLDAPLKSLGLLNAFESGGGFAPLGVNAPLAAVGQSTRIVVKEAGLQQPLPRQQVETEVPTIYPFGPTPFALRVDRPFFFAVQNNFSGYVLLIGAVFDPAPA